MFWGLLMHIIPSDLFYIIIALKNSSKSYQHFQQSFEHAFSPFISMLMTNYVEKCQVLQMNINNKMKTNFALHNDIYNLIILKNPESEYDTKSLPATII